MLAQALCKLEGFTHHYRRKRYCACDGG